MEQDSFFDDAVCHMVDTAKPGIGLDSLDSFALQVEASSTSIDTDANRDVLSSPEYSEPGKAITPSQGMFLFVLGEDTNTNTFELGILNEKPEALKKITSSPSLSTSAYLRPALNATMSELRSSLMAQVAARLTAVSMRLAVGILATPGAARCTFDSYEQQQLADIVCEQLGVAVEFYEWQGIHNRFARTHYLMVLLKEIVRSFTVPFEALVDALRLDDVAMSTVRRLASLMDRSIVFYSSVVGDWASNLIVTALQADETLRTATPAQDCANSPGSESLAAGLSENESAASLPSLSDLIPRKSNNEPRGCTSTPGDDPIQSNSQTPRRSTTYLYGRESKRAQDARIVQKIPKQSTTIPNAIHRIKSCRQCESAAGLQRRH